MRKIERMTDSEILLVLQEMKKLPRELQIEKMRSFAKHYELREISVKNSRRSGTSRNNP